MRIVKDETCPACDYPEMVMIVETDSSGEMTERNGQPIAIALECSSRKCPYARALPGLVNAAIDTAPAWGKVPGVKGISEDQKKALKDHVARVFEDTDSL